MPAQAGIQRGAGSAAISRQFEAVRASAEEERRLTSDSMAELYQQSSSLASLRQRPEYLNEYYGEVRDVLSGGSSYVNVVRDFYRSTGRSRGITDTAQVVIQSTYSRVVFE